MVLTATQFSRINELQSMEDKRLTREKVLDFIDDIAKKIKLDGAMFQSFRNSMTMLFDNVISIGDKMVSIGKIIFSKLMEFMLKVKDFVLSNPVAVIGAIVGGILCSFLSFVPIIGQILPLIGITAGAVMGVHIDALPKVVREVYALVEAFATMIKEIYQEIKSVITKK